MKAALYVRISTAHQNSALQLAELEKYLAERRWPAANVYQDVISGARTSRPGLNQLLADAAAGKFDCVLVWKLDRFGRSLVDCLNNIQALERAGVAFISVTQGLNTSHSDPAGRFLLHVLGAAAEFERSLIKERVAAGLAQAKKDGKQLGRPRKIFRRDELKRLREEEGLSLREIGARLGLTLATVARAVKAA
jgi:DNA invertase Pin-like site-specific DNA recombinase